MHTYAFVRLRDGKPATALGFAAWLRSARSRLPDGALLGAFTPQLGWASHERALLFHNAPEAARLLEGAEELAEVQTIQLTPTARPRPEDHLTAGGIFVHRWFVAVEADLDEFVRLSVAGWADFEQRFDARIFGLMRADTADPRGVRLLLLTRYADHGEWERSRDPTSNAMAQFRRRQELTLATWAASTLLMAP